VGLPGDRISGFRLICIDIDSFIARGFKFINMTPEGSDTGKFPPPLLKYVLQIYEGYVWIKIKVSIKIKQWKCVKFMQIFQRYSWLWQMKFQYWWGCRFFIKCIRSLRTRIYSLQNQFREDRWKKRIGAVHRKITSSFPFYKKCFCGNAISPFIAFVTLQ